jgi:hypothetical protein
MAKMDWDRVRSERLVRIRGWAGVDSDHTGGDGPLGTRWDEPYWPSGNKAGDLYRSKTARTVSQGGTGPSSLVVFLDTFIVESKNDEKLDKCSGRELLDYRETCKSVVSKVTGITWASERKDRRSISIVTKAVQGQEPVKDSVPIILLRTIDFFCQDEDLLACTNSELQRLCDVCEATVKRVNLQILEREGIERSSR